MTYGSDCRRYLFRSCSWPITRHPRQRQVVGRPAENRNIIAARRGSCVRYATRRWFQLGFLFIKKLLDDMGKQKFSVTHKDESIVELVRRTDHRTLAAWAIDCAQRVLPYFEERHPKDHRPRKAIEACQKWLDTEVFRMSEIRRASLAAHAAAREVGQDNAARSAARAAGQVAATPHVPTHSIGAANYALQAIRRATDSSEADAAVAKERDWQYQHLLSLTEQSTCS